MIGIIPYDHTAVITRVVQAASGASRDDFGDPVTPPAATSIYSGEATLQGMSYRDQRDVFGSVQVDGADWLFTPEGTFPYAMLPDDLITATITNPGAVGTLTKRGRIHDIDHLTPCAVVVWEPRNQVQNP